MSKKASEKIAVVMLNLGGPDSPNAIRPFLLNFFMDKNIIRLPVPFRCLLASYIAYKRTKREAGESYGELGGASPLLANSQAQAKALEKVLKANKGARFKTFVCMRYWHPMSPQVVREVRDWGADRIVILPLYPQYSTTTTRSSLQVWEKAMFEAGYSKPTSVICCYPKDKGFIQASADNIRKEYDKAIKDGYEAPRILFSAHGLPESVIKDGDPYQWQCEESAAAIVKALGIKNLDWNICYQSRVGRQKWIGPSTEDEIKRAAEDNKAIIIYPHAFTQEHVETLVELDVEYKEEAEAMGLHGYYRAQTVGTHPAYIEALADLVKGHVKKTGTVAAAGKCICPARFGRCCMKDTPAQERKAA